MRNSFLPMEQGVGDDPLKSYGAKFKFCNTRWRMRVSTHKMSLFGNQHVVWKSLTCVCFAESLAVSMIPRLALLRHKYVFTVISCEKQHTENALFCSSTGNYGKFSCYRSKTECPNRKSILSRFVWYQKCGVLSTARFQKKL